MTDPKEHGRQRDDFVFHMTDWALDLERLARLYKKPQDNATATELVVTFLSHATPHLSAAGRLLLDGVPDTFADSPGRRRGNDRKAVSTGRRRTRTIRRLAVAAK